MKTTIAFGLIGFGILLLISALGMLPYQFGFYFAQYWPSLLALAGLEIIIRRLARGKRSVVIPLLMLLVGVFLQLRNLNVLGFTMIDPLALVLAILLINFGIGLLNIGARHRWWRWGKWDLGNGLVNPKQFMKVGDIRYGDEPWHLEPLYLHNSAGSIRINLGTATIPEGETPIEITEWAGEVRIHVPDDVPVMVLAELNTGELRMFNRRQSGVGMSIKMSHIDSDYEEAMRKVKIHVKVTIGEVRIMRGI